MHEDEPINEYRIKVTVRNNLILSAIENAGHKSVASFCRSIGVSPQKLTDLISMRKPPLTVEGEFSTMAKMLMEELCLLPTDLWTSEQLTLKLARNSSQRSVSAEGMKAALGMHAEEMLELMKPTDPEEVLFRDEMVNVVKDQLDSLTPREAKILRMRYGIGCEEHTLEEVAFAFDVTRERIRQIEVSALRKLKKPERADSLRELLPDFDGRPFKGKPNPRPPLCEEEGHLFYENQNQVSVCAYCGIGEARWNRHLELMELIKKETT